MTAEEREIITDLKKCDFGMIYEHHKEELERKKNRSRWLKRVSIVDSKTHGDNSLQKFAHAAVKIENFSRKILIFFLFLLET